MATTAWTAKNLDKYFSSGSLVVALRQPDTEQDIKDILGSLSSQPKELVIVPSPAADVSSTDIRQALSKNKKSKGLLPSVYRYSRNQWLYVSLNKG